MRFTNLQVIFGLSVGILCASLEAKTSCGGYIEDFPGFSCVEESLQKEAGLGSYFLVKKEGERFALWGRPDTPEHQAQLALFEKFADNPLVVSIHESKIINGFILVVLDFPKNLTLKKYSTDFQFVHSFEMKTQFMLALTEGIQQISEKGYVVTDLNLENIWVDAEGKPVLVNLRFALPEGTQTYPRGSLPFMSPELTGAFQEGVQTTYVPADDVYSLGVVFYFLVKLAFPLENHLKDLGRLGLDFVYFDEGDFGDFTHVVHKTVVPRSHRISIQDLHESLARMISKPNLYKLENKEFYTFDDPQIHEFSNSKKFVLVGIGLISFIFLLLFLVFTLRCLCKTAWLFVCCPCFFGKKKEDSQVKVQDEETDNQNKIMIQDLPEDDNKDE